jgi:hypothetical protein
MWENMCGRWRLGYHRSLCAGPCRYVAMVPKTVSELQIAPTPDFTPIYDHLV